MKLLPTPLAGLTLIETTAIADARGRFVRVFCEQELAAMTGGNPIAQVNLATTHRAGSIRGLHFQREPAAESKLVRCLRGRVYDVAVDLRKGSTTFLHWHAYELDASGQRQVYIPAGFAHGFQALEDDVELLYLHGARWSPAHEGTLRFDDPALGIAWPLPITQVSDKDRQAPLLGAGFCGISA